MELNFDSIESDSTESPDSPVPNRGRRLLLRAGAIGLGVVASNTLSPVFIDEIKRRYNLYQKYKASDDFYKHIPPVTLPQSCDPNFKLEDYVDILPWSPDPKSPRNVTAEQTEALTTTVRKLAEQPEIQYLLMANRSIYKKKLRISATNDSAYFTEFFPGRNFLSVNMSEIDHIYYTNIPGREGRMPLGTALIHEIYHAGDPRVQAEWLLPSPPDKDLSIWQYQHIRYVETPAKDFENLLSRRLYPGYRGRENYTDTEFDENLPVAATPIPANIPPGSCALAGSQEAREISRRSLLIGDFLKR